MSFRLFRRLRNIAIYGVGSDALERKRAVKNAARQQVFESDLWEKDMKFARRSYKDYDEYLDHQAAKLKQIEHRLYETYEEDLAEFRRRFKGCLPLAEARNVVCLGARLGTEVRALHSLGYFSVGVDLNPGEENNYVLHGDFHHLVFPDNSADAVYCNALDHVLNLEKFLAEISRILRPGGLFVADLLEGFEEGFTPGKYEAMVWRTREGFIEDISQQGFDMLEARDLGHHRRDHWAQIVFRSHSALGISSSPLISSQV